MPVPLPNLIRGILCGWFPLSCRDSITIDKITVVAHKPDSVYTIIYLCPLGGCSERGLPAIAYYYTTRWSLTPPFHPYLSIRQAVSFCCPFLRKIAPSPVGKSRRNAFRGSHCDTLAAGTESGLSSSRDENRAKRSFEPLPRQLYHGKRTKGSVS